VWTRVGPGALALLLGALGAAGLAASPAGATEQSEPTVVGGERLAAQGLVVDAPGAAQLPAVKAASWVLADLDTGEVLAAKNPHGRFRPASTLKILTALTVLPKVQPDQTYVAQWEDANAEGSRVGLVPDASYTVHDLFQALMLVSGNDAASALANAAGGVAPTVERMNATARSLGALDTHAVNPSGLDAPGQLSSAYDLAVISRAAMAREDFRTYTSTVKSQFPGKMPRAGKARKTYEIYTQDRLLLNYRGAIGIKTGWTTKARGTFVGAATRGGHTLVATVMHTEGQSWREAGALLTWGFKNLASAEPVGTLDAVAKQDTGAAVGPKATAEKASAEKAASDGGGGLPFLVKVPIVLVALVVVLRTRVLLRRRMRRVRLEPVPGRVPAPGQRRDLRRETVAASAAPMPAPSSTPRTRPDDRDLDGPPASASTGAAS
jgi:D-alanyl-D-alanine carboxypeptidase (penicillin-binding protein 5/6)